ncbi:MAG TPA: DUF3209 family protein [Candidatus Binataceae bacterium]|nr:DUF3209 family protein [Candidatus Binataceae bacterium]
MACHEIAALRLGLMKILGRKDEAERQHELAELGDASHQPGPVASLCEADDFESIRQLYELAVSSLEERVSSTAADDPKLPYLRSLVILTKKVELDLANEIGNLTRLYRDLEQMHDFVHEIYPVDD